MLIKIKEYKLSQRGIRGAVLSIPRVFLADNDLKAGDVIEVHRGFQDGKDVLVLIPKKKPDNNLAQASLKISNK